MEGMWFWPNPAVQKSHACDSVATQNQVMFWAQIGCTWFRVKKIE